MILSICPDLIRGEIINNRGIYSAYAPGRPPGAFSQVNCIAITSQLLSPLSNPSSSPLLNPSSSPLSTSPLSSPSSTSPLLSLLSTSLSSCAEIEYPGVECPGVECPGVECPGVEYPEGPGALTLVQNLIGGETGYFAYARTSSGVKTHVLSICHGFTPTEL